MSPNDQGTPADNHSNYPDFDESYLDFRDRMLPVLDRELSEEDKQRFIKMIFYGAAFTLVQLIKVCYKSGKPGEKQITRVFNEIIDEAISLCESPLPRIDIPDSGEIN